MIRRNDGTLVRPPTPAEAAIAEGRVPPDWYVAPAPPLTRRERLREAERRWLAMMYPPRGWGDLPW
jgi:hypothetical protein